MFGPREVAHRDLADPDSRAGERDEQLGREEGAVRAHARERDTREDVAAEELESAVDVTPRATEQHADEPVVDPGDEQAAPGVRSLLAKADHRVGPVARREEPREIGEVELPVAVRVEDPRLRGGEEPRADGAAVAAACAVVDDADTPLARGQLVRDRAGAIGAPVVDDRHLEVVGEARQYLEGGCDEGGDVLLFVQRGEEEREPHEPCGQGR